MRIPTPYNYFLPLIAPLLLFWIAPIPALSQALPVIQSLEWEAQSATPLEYQGKSLPSEGTMIRVFAVLASGVNQSDLALDWTVDNKPFGSHDPLLLVFPATKAGGDRHEVRLHIRNKKTNAVDDATISIPVVERELYFYTIDELGEVRASISPNRPSVIGGKSVSFLVQSYFFPTANLIYHWDVDGRAVTGTPRTPNILTLMTPPNPPKPIQTIIRATVSHPRYNGVSVEKEVVLEIK